MDKDEGGCDAKQNANVHREWNSHLHFGVLCEPPTRLHSVFILFLAEALEENPIERAQAGERTVITSYCGTLTRILCALQCVPSFAHSIGGVEIANRFESPAQHC